MKVFVCSWKACSENFSNYILKRLKNDKEFYNIKDLEIEESPCMWMCSSWPNIKIDKEIFNNVTPIKASDLVLKKLWLKKSNKKKKK